MRPKKARKKSKAKSHAQTGKAIAMPKIVPSATSLINGLAEMPYQALDAISDEIAVLDGNGTIIAVNQAWQRFALANSGDSDHPMARSDIGCNYLEICKADQSQTANFATEAFEGILAVLNGELPSFSLEYPCNFANQQRWFKMSITPLGAVGQGVVAVHTDISERKCIEEELRQRESYQRAVLDNFPFLVWLKDQNSHFLAVNQPFAKASGYLSPSLLLGKSDFDVWPHALAALYQADDQIVLESGQSRVSEETIEINGKQVWFETFKSPVMVDNKIIGTVGFARDISKRKTWEVSLAESRNLLRTIIDTVPIRVFWKDNNLHYLGCNKAFAKDAGMGNPKNVIGKDDYQMAWENLAGVFRADDRDVLSSGIPKLSYDEPQTLPNGQTIWVRTSKVPLKSQDGHPIGLLGLYEDITERKEAEERLQLAASVFSNSHEGIMITDAGGKIIDINNAFSKITGYSPDEVVGRTPHILSSGLQDQGFYAAMWRDLIEHGCWYGEVWNRRKNGEVYAILQTISAVRDGQGKILQYVALFSDITTLKEHERQLEHIAYYDALTGLPNRVLLADRLQQAMAQALRRGQRLALAFLDLDGFKAINDSHGHEAGDQLLVALANRMKQALREGDTLARLGGDEFVAIQVDLSEIESSLPMHTRLLAAAAQPIQCGDLVLQVSASIGITFYPQTEEISAEQLLVQADQAMYQAKLAGKNRHYVFNSEQDSRKLCHHETVDEIHRALNQNEFILHYQPKVNMRTGKILGVEALIRWQHPDRGLLPPIVFLQVVEDHPLAIDIGVWMLETALSQLEAWAASGLDIPVSVNISARLLHQIDFVERLQAIIAAHPTAKPCNLELEIQETATQEDLPHVSQTIKSCLAMGIKFILDDFGTGYSSLTHLKRLPVATLKINPGYIRDILADPDDLMVVDGILCLAQAFHRQVIAEGVETVEHSNLLLQLGCEQVQGNGIAHPMPGHEIPAWFASWQPAPEWRQLSTANRDDLPLHIASVEHRAWIVGIENYLKGERINPPPLDHKQCQLGQWLNDEGLAHYGTKPAFQILEQLHQQAHEQAKALCGLHTHKQTSEIQAHLDTLYHLKDALLVQLKNLALDIRQTDV
ncbi:MAG: EAL domain-containing protein [Methylococcales bacterium]|nr:EAL domain-containing protein [Methylococcales bacterium]